MNALANEYGMQLADDRRSAERAIRPPAGDRPRAGDGRAGDERRGEPRRRPRSRRWNRKSPTWLSEPHGAGLDVPDWLSALEDEVTEARSRMSHVSSSDRLSRRIGQVRLSWDEILEQLGGQ